MNIKNNLVLKIISVVLAIVIWVGIINIVTPLVEVSLIVPIEFNYNEDTSINGKSYNIKDSYNNARIRYRIRRNSSNTITANDIKAFIDINNDTVSGEQEVKLKFFNGVDKHMADFDYSPKKISIAVDEIITKKYKVVAHTTKQLPPGLVIENIDINPKEVEVRGTLEELENIGEVNIEISLDRQESSFSGQAAVKLSDTFGNTISSGTVRSVVDNVDYFVTVYSSKNITIETNITGNVAIGHEYAGAIVNPSSIGISATRDVLTKIHSVTLPEIDISELKENTDFVFDLTTLLPEGVKIIGSSNNVTVTIGVNRLNTRNNVFGPTNISTSSNIVPYE